MSIPNFMPGDPAPWFMATSSAGPNFAFNSLGGRYIALLFLGATTAPLVQPAMAAVEAAGPLFRDEHVCLFAVSMDPADQKSPLAQKLPPGFHFFWDFDGQVSRRYGALRDAASEQPAQFYRPFWLIIDPMLRVMQRFDLSNTDQALSFIAGLPPVEQHADTAMVAPVLIVPRVFEPDFCRQLIAHYEEGSPVESGFMRDIGGKTVGVMDPKFKRRSDLEVDGPLRAEAKWRIERHLLPEIRKAFQYNATRMERFLVACYDGEQQGFFRRHRDNTTRGTAHRRFAVTINLNAESFTGGELCLPEFGSRTYRAPTGGAVVFSCSLLHEAQPVTQGRRYAFLPFLYDEAAQAIREDNLKYLAPDA